MSTAYDVIIIGAGAAGLTCASGLSQAGKRVLLIEQNTLGGECTNSGCIPSKALLHYAHTFYTAQKISGDVPELSRYRDQVFHYIAQKITTVQAHENQPTLEAQGITVVHGTAHFTSATTISVAGINYRFQKAIIASGSYPRTISITGAEAKDILTNESIFSLTKIPERLLIVGGGPIGVELAQAFAQLQCKVTIIEQSTTIGGQQEPEIAQALQTHLSNLGVHIITQADIVRVENRQAIVRQANSETRRIPYEKLLLAIGRVPNIPKGLGTAGIQHTENTITIDRSYRTSNGRVYAIGDGVLTDKFTHTADASARSVVLHILSRGLFGRKNYQATPRVLYTNPEVAQVGLHEQAARIRYGTEKIRTITIPINSLDRSITDNSTGVAKIIVKGTNGKILGASIMGPQAGELISYFSLAINNRWTLWRLARNVYPYPTQSLLIKKAFDIFLQQLWTQRYKNLKQVSKSLLPYIGVLTLWILLITISYRWFDSTADGELESVLKLFTIIAASSWAPLLFILTYTIRPIIFFPALWLSILAGAFFGLTNGFIYTSIGATLSAILAYAIGRWFNPNKRIPDTDELTGWRSVLQNNPFESTLFLRLSFLPFDPISYLAGILKIKLLPYILGTILGIIPGTLLYVSIGASISIPTLINEGITLSAIDWKYLILAGIIFLAAILISGVIRRYRAYQTRLNTPLDT